MLSPSNYLSVRDAAKSLANGNINKFLKALDNKADVNARPDNTPYSIFERACTIPGRSIYIRACLQHDALITESNPETKEYPIHLAARSFDSNNLGELLQSPRIFVDQKFDKDRTALYLLFEEINGNNYNKVFECIKLLLEYGANINATNEDSISPIALLVSGNESWRKEILDYCLKYNVNVDFRNGQARKKIEKHFPGTTIPEIDTENVTFEVLRDILTTGTTTEDDFLVAYEKYRLQNQGCMLQADNLTDLLSLTVYRSKPMAARKLLEQHIVDGTFADKSALLSELLEKCCNRGNVPMLEMLLNIIPKKDAELINQKPLLSLLVKQMDVYKDKNECPFFKCMEILLDDPRIEIDKIDEQKCTAMQYAGRYKIDHAQQLLFEHGAYIGGVDIFGHSTITEMDSSLLEKHLDSCVTSNGCKKDDQNYEIIIDYSNFVPPNRNSNDEMQPIVRMARSSTKKHLLWHPVVASILLLKWMRVVYLLYINLICSGVFTVSFATYVGVYLGQDTTILGHICWITSICGWIYFTLRELVQFLLNMRTHFRSPRNILEMLLIIVAGAVLFYDSSLWQAKPIALLIPLIGVQFTLQIVMLPVNVISTNMMLLKRVLENFLKLLAIFSVLLVSFALSFNMTYRNSKINQLNETDHNKETRRDDNDSDQFQQFQGIMPTLMKTAVMFTGEFDAADINYSESWIVYILLLLFIFIIAIVLGNLIIGLAVSDTAAILAESEIIGIQKMVFNICILENALHSYRFINEKLRFCLQSNTLVLFSKNGPLSATMLQPHRSHIIKCKTMPQQQSGETTVKQSTNSNYEMVPTTERNYNSTIINIENGSTHEDVPDTTWEYSTECWKLKLFDKMLEKVVQSALEILVLRQAHNESITFRLSRLEQQITLIDRNFSKLEHHLAQPSPKLRTKDQDSSPNSAPNGGCDLSEALSGVEGGGSLSH